MTYQLRLSRRNKQQIEKLPGNIANIARRRIVSLRTEPRPSDAKELDEHPGYFRVWLDANHRLVWQVDEDAKR